MLQLKINNTVILGVDAENVRRLQEGQPIVVDAKKFESFDKIGIIYGDTVDDIRKELEGLLNLKIPEVGELKEGEVRDVTDEANAMNQTNH